MSASINGHSVQDVVAKWGDHNRRIPRTSAYRPTISFFSHRFQRSLFTESYNEFFNLIDLESQLAVQEYMVQPFTLSYADGASYTPDTAYVDENGELWAQEVKGVEFELTDEHEARFERIADALAESGCHFELTLIDKSDPWFERQKLLMKYSSAGHSDLLTVLDQPYEGTVRELAEQLGAIEKWIPQIYAALFYQLISSPPGHENDLITFDSPIVFGGACHD